MSMHQTTVRFSSDLWEELEVECAALGVSIAQYLREAAVARLAHAAARREGHSYNTALEAATHGRAFVAQEQSRAKVDETQAVMAQSRLARERSREIRGRLEETRERHRAIAAKPAERSRQP